MTRYGTIEELEEILLEDELSDLETPAQLIVYNDDFNTFDWVIESFIEVLKHSKIQAEQLSLLIHFGGKATVKTAPEEELRPQRDALIERGLSAVIEHLQD